MPVVRWQTELKVSGYALCCLAGWQLAVVTALLVSPWYGLVSWIKPLVVIAVLAEGWRAARRIVARNGTLYFDDQEAWSWQQREWRLQSRLYWLSWAVLIDWRSGDQRQRFWLMRDSMSEQAWRNLRFYWLQGRNRHWQAPP